jgi:hypothetical protein
MAEPLRALEVEAEAPSVGKAYTLKTEQGEATLTVPPPTKWRASVRAALADLNRVDGDVVWARSVLSSDDFADWLRCDPTPEESGEFLSRVFAGNGESLGKSKTSTASSKTTRK